ncbi:chloramphenicol acetyltransferase [Flavobacterium facile]|uniref:chloramphenicol acetyltransferase n=1 Tax=Flavobacterium facile TaxID=2893174 RepID=UPI002E771016|nr:chloramphenicol acetyltransferase [Flavobacterium sp. T-12]
MKQKLDITTWNRKEHFEFFCKFEEPFFGTTIQLDCTKAYTKAKELGVSFFTYYLHKTLVAVNKTENFRYRIHDGKVFIYDKINISSTILRDDKTFGFSEIEYNENLNAFIENYNTEASRVKNTSGLFTREYNENIVHFSALPWINFTSISHSRSFTFPDSCPKFSFGKMTTDNDKKFMSMSVHVHHGLVDGYHLGLFFEEFERLMNE